MNHYHSYSMGRKIIPPLLLLAVLLTIIAVVVSFRNQGNNLPQLPNIKSQKEEGRDPVLDIPHQDNPVSSLEDNYKKIEAKAQDAETLDIKNCDPEPLVWRVDAKKKLIVKNSDKKDHTIVLNQDAKYTIPAQGMSTIGINFDKGIGPYGYGCDDLPKTVGYFFLTL